MPVLSVVMHNFFRDSIQLMRLSEEAKKVAGVRGAIAAIGDADQQAPDAADGIAGQRGQGRGGRGLGLGTESIRGV